MYSTRYQPLRGRAALTLGAIWASLRHIVNESEMELSALFLGGYMAVWGFWLLLPWSVFGGARAYDAMAALAPEPVWGAMFLTIGLLKIVGVLLSDLYWTFRLWRWTTLLGLAGYLFLATMFWMGNPTAPGGVLYTLLSLVTFNIYRRLMRTG